MLIYFFKLRSLTAPFTKYPRLEEMLALRKLGYSYTVLADRYRVPKYTIRYICRRFGLAGKTATKIRSATTTRKQNKKTPILETINQGKTYAEYLQDERDRKWKRLTQKHHSLNGS